MTRRDSTRWPAMVLAGAMLMAGAGCGGAAQAQTPPRGMKAVIIRDASLQPVRFAADQVALALMPARYTVAQARHDAPPAEVAEAALVVRFIVGSASAGARDLAPQGYALQREGREIRILATDAVGAMYGGLDLAETIRLDGLDGVREKRAEPFIARRGVKFNIPLDARTPSYDDSGDAAQQNIATMWEWDFWEAYLDDMARNRYNVLTLWNPHPFPSLVKLETYPDVALDDVCVSKIKPTARHGSIGEHMGVSKEVLASVRAVKTMTIDEKIAFWRRVMQRAHERGIEVYIITWNVLTNSAGGKYGIDDRQDNPKTIAYLRDCVRQTILTYPHLAGLGVTAGERMKRRDDEFAKEKWLWKAYGEGVLDAKKAQPERTVRFIHRVWQTGVGDVLKEWSRYPGPFEVSFKYARARLYSSPKPPFSLGLQEELKAHKIKSWWNLRNDDNFVFRWGDPDYVREFLGNFPADLTAGYYVGSDGYAWGREFISTEPDSPRQLEIRKHWYRFMLWGRLGYDPALDRAYFEKRIAHRLPQAPAAAVYDAWQAASKIIPLVNRFHWRNWDFMWAVEGCMDQRKGFHTVRDFIANETMEGSGLMTIPAYVGAHLKGERPTTGTALEVAAELISNAKTALAGVTAVRNKVAEPSKELRRTLGDMEAMAHLGHYYAAKIAGATELALFERSARADHKEKAVAHLEQAVKHWEAYAKVATSQYRPQLLARTRDLDWQRLLKDVKQDVEIARSAKAK